MIEQMGILCFIKYITFIHLRSIFFGEKKSIFWSSFYGLGTIEGPEKSPGRLWESLQVYILGRERKDDKKVKLYQMLISVRRNNNKAISK